MIANVVYWTNEWSSGAVRKMIKDGSGDPQDVLAGLDMPSSLALGAGCVWIAERGTGQIVAVPP